MGRVALPVDLDGAERTFGRAPGIACVVAGVLGLAAAVMLAFLPPAVGDDRFSYPLTPGGFTAIQVFFAVHHLPLAWGAYVVWRRGAAGRGRLAGLGGIGATATLGLLSVQELVAIAAADAPYPSELTELIEAIYGVVSMLIGLAFVVLGLAVARAGRWTGWARWVPLAIGIYVFVPLTPAILGPFVVARLAIGGWMLLFAALGVALLRDERGMP